jgi:hypothetical protein
VSIPAEPCPFFPSHNSAANGASSKSALNGFDDLDPVDAIENVRFDLRAMLRLIDPADKAFTIPLFVGVETPVGDERVAGKRQRSNFPDL